MSNKLLCSPTILFEQTTIFTKNSYYFHWIYQTRKKNSPNFTTLTSQIFQDVNRGARLAERPATEDGDGRIGYLAHLMDLAEQ